MRIVRSLLTFAFAVLTAAIVIAALALYLAVTGRNLPLLRTVVSALGRSIEGQRTEALRLRVHLHPRERALSAQATLTVRADGAGRRRAIFLLNDGLRVRRAWSENGDGTRTPLGVMRLWLLAIVELPRPLAAGEVAQIGIAYDGSPRPGVGEGVRMEADQVVLSPEDLWYPSDVQPGFTTDVELVLPAELTLAHNGRERSRVVEGTSARVRVASDGPVNGLALVAGRYQVLTGESGDRSYRVLLADGVDLDAPRLLDSMVEIERNLAAHYGPSGFASATLCVPRRLERAFNDGSGLVVIPPPYFADGRYGFETIAHEVSHNWWGGTVAAHWLAPGTGGEWIVEGMAQFSAWRAVGERFGEAALVYTLAQNAFDPDATGALVDMSVLDNAFDPRARATIYRKGGYVTYMLAQQLGNERFDTAARAFIDEFRHRAATAADLERVFAASSGLDLGSFFATWVRSNAALDIALEPVEGSAVVRNLRPATAPDALALWRVGPDGGLATSETAVGQSLALADARRVVVDPLAAVADMFRSNNALPRRDPPRLVAASTRGEVMVVDGEPVAWEPAVVRILDPTGRTLHTWSLDRGLVADPQWSADGTRILALEGGLGGAPTLVSLNSSDGARQTLGHHHLAAADADGTVVARGGRLIRLGKRGGRVLVEHAEGHVVGPLPAPRGGAIAYGLRRGTDLELRLLEPGAAASRVLFTWPAAHLRWHWAPDGTRLFAVLPGSWDWQLWELPIDGTAPRPLVEEAAWISDFAVAPDGHRLAVIARAELDQPNARSDVFVIDSRSNETRRYELAGRTGLGVAWLFANALVVLTTDAADLALPQLRELQRLNLDDGTLEGWGK